MISAWGRVSRLAFTLFMLVGLIAGALVTHTGFQLISTDWLNRVGFSPNDLWGGQVWRMFSATFVTLGEISFWGSFLLAGILVGLAEWQTGWRRTAATFWGVHMLTLLLLSLIISLAASQLRALGLDASTATRDVGPSAGYFACLGLVSSRMKPPWNWVSKLAILLILIIILFLPVAAGENARINFSANLAHLLAFPLGWLSARAGRNTMILA
jgi:hypothetical protein